MEDPVLSLLQKNELAYTVSGRDYLIRCLNPSHDDSNPSLRVDKVTGISHCFACGWKRNLFRHFGILTTPTPVKVSKLKKKLEELYVDTSDTEGIKHPIPWSRVFRGISVQTLRKFEAFYTLDNTQNMQDRIIFPIKDISGKILSYVGRHVGQENPRYKHFPSGKSALPYPLNHTSKSVVLVEGVFDLLNLYDKGLTNVICCFGTDTLKNHARDKLLPLKAQGVQKLYIMFDGDDAGRNAAKEIKPVLEEAEYVVEIIDLPDDTDPGEISSEWVESIKEYING